MYSAHIRDGQAVGYPVSLRVEQGVPASAKSGLILSINLDRTSIMVANSINEVNMRWGKVNNSVSSYRPTELYEYRQDCLLLTGYLGTVTLAHNSGDSATKLPSRGSQELSSVGLIN